MSYQRLTVEADLFNMPSVRKAMIRKLTSCVSPETAVHTDPRRGSVLALPAEILIAEQPMDFAYCA